MDERRLCTYTVFSWLYLYIYIIITVIIVYMKEHLELFIMTTIHLLMNYSKKTTMYKLTQEICNLLVQKSILPRLYRNLSSKILNILFKVLDKPYNFRRNAIFDSRNIHTEHLGINSLSYLGPK